MLSVNNALTEFAASDSFANFIDFFQSIPNDIQETELYHRIQQFEQKEISYEDVEWLQNSLGYMTYESAVSTLKRKTAKSQLDQYIISVIDSDDIRPREKLIVLLAHFEPIVYQSLTYERKSYDKIKLLISQSSKDIHEIDSESCKKVLIAGIVFIVFSNTDKYKNGINKKIPFRNHILHRGMLDYTDDDALKAYEILVYFIAQLESFTEH